MNNVLDQVLSFTEAEEKYNLRKGLLRRYVNYPIEKKKLIKGVDYRKSGNTWLITKEAMEREYLK